MIETSRRRPPHAVQEVSEGGELREVLDEGRRCIGCQSTFVGVRCGHCGVPFAPGGYRVERIIGQGNHSRVYEAEKDGQRVALKELLFALVPERSQLDAFAREAALLRQLKHPRIPRFVDSFSEGEGVQQRLYLAQELVPGLSLLQALESHRFDEEEARQIAREVLGVLVYLHGLSPRVIHRDIKPANLMRRPDGSLALVDFGAARDLQRGVTHGATLVGTFGYMPPEQLGGTVDETADLYALGATLIHLLARKPPDELLRHDMALDFAESLNVSERTARFLSKLVARQREDRFRTAREALAALDAVEPIASPSRPSATRIAAWIATGVGLLAGVLIGIAFREEPPPPAPPRPPVTAAPPVVAPPDVVEPPVSPPKAAPPASKPRDTAKAPIDVAVVETLRGPPDRGLLRDDRNFSLRARVEPPLEGCETPPTVELEKAALRVEGPGGLDDPKSRLSLDVKLRSNGLGDGACSAVDFALHAPGGAAVSRVSRITSDRPGMELHRTLDFTFPRTLGSIDVCVGGKCVVRLNLRNGKVERR